MFKLTFLNKCAPFSLIEFFLILISELSEDVLMIY